MLWQCGRKRKESLQLRLWNLNSTSNSPVAPRRLSGQIPASQCEAERAQMQTNIEKHVPRVMMSLLMSSLPISFSHPLFQCRYSNSRDVVASCPSFCCHDPRAPQRACWHLLYIERKIGNDFGGEMVDFTGPKVRIEWLNFTAAQSAKMSNSGTQDDSPVWGTEN